MGYPTTFLIDRNGVIRHRDLRGPAVDPAVEALLAEAIVERTGEPR